MTVYADPIRAAREAGYKEPERAWSELSAQEDIVGEIRRRCENIRSIFESTAVCGLYRLAYGGVNDALTFINREIILKEDLKELDLRNVSEIKKTDKGIEVKFCDRLKPHRHHSRDGRAPPRTAGSRPSDPLRFPVRLSCPTAPAICRSP